MKKVIHSLIHYDQTAYVTGRYIDESVRLVDDLLEVADQENFNELFLQLTLKKHLIQLNMILFLPHLRNSVFVKVSFNGLRP